MGLIRYVVMVVFRLLELRMEKEGLLSRLHQHEDQLAQLQEELRRVSESTSQSGSVHVVNTTTHTGRHTPRHTPHVTHQSAELTRCTDLYDH